MAVSTSLSRALPDIRRQSAFQILQRESAKLLVLRCESFKCGAQAHAEAQLPINENTKSRFGGSILWSVRPDSGEYLLGFYVDIRGLLQVIERATGLEDEPSNLSSCRAQGAHWRPDRCRWMPGSAGLRHEH